jgi:hypothetical protein
MLLAIQTRQCINIWPDVARSGAVSTGLADDLAQVLDLLCKLTISGETRLRSRQQAK